MHETTILTEPSNQVAIESSLSPVIGSIYLVRYGAVSEVVRASLQSDELIARGTTVVLSTDRGIQSGIILERLKPTTSQPIPETSVEILRMATENDRNIIRQQTLECENTFADWCARIVQWELNLELIDLEWTLDRQKLILYVLCERGPDSTKLALQAAAAGLGIVEVLPVTAEGVLSLPQNSGGCGTGSCGCSH